MRNRLLGLLFGVFLWVALVLSVIHISSLDLNFYERKYEELNVAENIGVSNDDLMKSTHVLLDYLVGKTDSLEVYADFDGVNQEFFNQREKDHMIDVQVLFVNTIHIRNISIIGLFLSGALILWLNRKKALDVFILGIKEASMILGFVFAFLVTFAVLDFDSFWIYFHKVLFSNDLWLLNPNTDNLILMVPLPFFFSLVSLILYRVILGLGLLYTIVYGIENQGYNHRFLKWFALVTMTIDHVGHFLFPDLIELRIVGRLAFPIFAYLFALSYRYTSNQKKLLIQVSVAAVLTQILLYFTGVRELVNIFFLFSLAFLAFYAFDKGKMWVIIVLALVAEYFTVDYGLYGLFILVLFYAYYGDKKKQLSGYISITLIYSFIQFVSLSLYLSLPTLLSQFLEYYWVYFLQALSILAVGLLWFYRSEKPMSYQKKSLNVIEKYFFYFYYPIHLALLGILRGLL